MRHPIQHTHTMRLLTMQERFAAVRRTISDLLPGRDRRKSTVVSSLGGFVAGGCCLAPSEAPPDQRTTNRGNARISLERAAPVRSRCTIAVCGSPCRRTYERTRERLNERTNERMNGRTRTSASRHSLAKRMARGFSGQLRGCS